MQGDRKFSHQDRQAVSRRSFLRWSGGAACAAAGGGSLAPLALVESAQSGGDAVLPSGQLGRNDTVPGSIAQDFKWHDAGQGATYVFGEDGYLKMDGSRGRVCCSRLLARSIRSPERSLELGMRVVLGKRYHMVLLTGAGTPAVDCQIDENARVRFARAGQYVESGRALTFQHGLPYSDPAKRKWYVVESDEHRLRLEQFDFSTRSFRFVLDGADPVLMAGCVTAGAKDLAKVLLQTENAGVGNMIRLREYAQEAGGAVVDHETFPLYWKPIPAPPDGMPDDNVCDTLMRPVDYHWLQTSTRYGYVKATVPPMPRGQIEFEIKTPNIAVESCLVLEEYEGVIKSGKIQVGMLGGKMILSTGSGPATFDEPVQLVNNRVYRVRVAWDKDARACRAWVNGSVMHCNGSAMIPLTRPVKRGIDTITLHPGDSGARLTSLEKAQGRKPRSLSPVVTYWGKFLLHNPAGTDQR